MQHKGPWSKWTVKGRLNVNVSNLSISEVDKFNLQLGKKHCGYGSYLIYILKWPKFVYGPSPITFKGVGGKG